MEVVLRLQGAFDPFDFVVNLSIEMFDLDIQLSIDAAIDPMALTDEQTLDTQQLLKVMINIVETLAELSNLFSASFVRWRLLKDVEITVELLIGTLNLGILPFEFSSIAWKWMKKMYK